MEPDLHAIEEIAQPYIHVITPGWTVASVRFLAQGAFNKVYTITARNQDTCLLKDYIFRVALPIYSHYKVESDVATTEFARSSTNIPVPFIYAFDSSSANKIGSLYMRGDNRNSDFYIGPPIHTRLYEGDRLSQQVNRGPFESLQAFYDAILDLTQRQPKHKMRAALKEKVSKHVCTDVEGGKVYHAIRMHMNRLELKDGLPQNSQSVEETTLAQVDEDDHRDEWRWGIGKSHLVFLPDDLFFYRDLLPKLCPLPPVSEPLTTMLSHPDMSMDNIFVDDAGKLVVLIDWERALVEADMLKCWIPEFLNEEEAYSTPLGTTGIFDNENNKIFTEERSGHLKKWSEGGDIHVRSMIEKTKLRAVYEAELRCLHSPLAQVCNRDPAFEWAVESLGEALVMEGVE